MKKWFLWISVFAEILSNVIMEAYFNLPTTIRLSVINHDNKLITLPNINRIIWIHQIIKDLENMTDNNI